jgi:hypothetical protein
MNNTNENGYDQGDEIRYTGNVVTLNGADFREFVYLEGHKQGQIGLKLTESARSEMDSQRKAEYEAEQAGYRRLATRFQ